MNTNIQITHTTSTNMFVARTEDGTAIAQWPTIEQMGEWVRNRGGQMGGTGRTIDGERFRRAFVQDARSTFVCGIHP